MWFKISQIKIINNKNMKVDENQEPLELAIERGVYISLWKGRREEEEVGGGGGIRPMSPANGLPGLQLMRKNSNSSILQNLQLIGGSQLISFYIGNMIIKILHDTLQETIKMGCMGAR